MHLLRQRTAFALIQRVIFLTLFVPSSLIALGQASRENQIQELPPNQIFERELAGTETHRYRIELQANEFFQIRVEQKGIDVTLRLLDEKGNVLTMMDSPNSKEGPETLSFVAGQAGRFTLEASGLDAQAEKGSYTIRRELPRTATAKDRRRVDVEHLFVAGVTARDTDGGIDTAIKILSEALKGWEELGETYLAGLTTQQLQQLRDVRSQFEARPLPVGETVERQLKGGDGNFYTINLKQGQVLQLDLTSKGVNVLVLVARDPEPKTLGRADFGLDYERETLTLVAEQAGLYLVLVRSLDASQSGRYQLTSQIKEAASVTDKDRIQAANLLEEGIIKEEQATADGLGAALISLTQSRELWRKIGDPYWEGYTSAKVGSVYMDLGETQSALESHNRALALFKTANDAEGEGTTSNNIGLLYSNSGKRMGALNYYHRALTLFRSAGSRISEARTLNNIGAVYDDLGEKQEALRAYSQALELVQKLGDKTGEAMALNNLGKVYAELGDTQKGLDHLNRALAIARATNNKLGEAAVLNNMTAVKNKTSDAKPEVKDLEKALQLAREIGNKNAEATLMSNLGFAYFNQRDYQRGLDYFNQSLPLLRAAEDKEREAQVLNNEMVCWERLGNRRLAIWYGKQAINRFQDLRFSIQELETETQRFYLRTLKAYYAILAEIMIREGRTDDIVEVLNLHRDQQFFDATPAIVSTGRLTLSRREEQFAERYESAIRKAAEVSLQLEGLRRKASSAQPNEQLSAQLEVLNRELGVATAAFLSILKDAEREFAKRADEADKVPVPTVTGMQTMLRELSTITKQKAVILYTLIGNETFSVVLVTPDDGVKIFTTQEKEPDLNTKLVAFHERLKRPDLDPRPLGHELYEIIFKPVEGELTRIGAQTLVWQLDGSLRYVPMAALWDGKKYLVERFQHVAFTRADTERMRKAVTPIWMGTGFGSSEPRIVVLPGDDKKIVLGRLPSVPQELRSIFRGDDNNVFLGPRFTKEAWHEALKRRRPLVHIASHFVFNPGDSSRSFLLLGDGTVLTLSEMRQHPDLFMAVELLTLSACETAASEPDANGREIDGFAELAQRLGAASVLASLWRVADESTSLLMTEFYRLRRENPQRTKATALQLAQRGMLEGTLHPSMGKQDRQTPERTSDQTKRVSRFPNDPKRPYAHPYYWAPFVMIGNWR